MELCLRQRGLTFFDASVVTMEGIEGAKGHKTDVKITSLDLSFNKLQYFCGARFVPHLVTLDLSHNELKSCSGFEALSATLTRLNLSSNRLLSIEGVSHLVKCSHLDASNNRVKDLRTCSLPPRLETLDFSGNQISNLKGLERQQSLLKLRVADNEIRHLEDLLSLSGLRALRHICLQNNRVERLTKLLPFLAATIPKLTTLNGLPLSQAEANQQVRQARMRQLVREHSIRNSIQTVHDKSMAIDAKDQEDLDPEEIELQRMEAQVRGLKKAAQRALNEEREFARQNAKLKRELLQATNIFEEQQRQLASLYTQVETLKVEEEELSEEVVALDNTFKLQHASLVVSKLRK